MKPRPDINRLLRKHSRSHPRGAPMGARSYLKAPELKCYLQRVRMIDGDYAADGTYWGSGGDPLWCAFHTYGPNRVYVRAATRKAAIAAVLADFPEAAFFRN